MEIIRELIGDNNLCFDIGANIGRKTSEMLNIGCSVVCVEPQDDCCSVLRSIYGNNPNVKIIKKSLGAARGVGKLYRASENTISSMSTDFITEVKKDRFSGYTWESNPIECEMVTIDDIINEFGIPGFCKIDVEGYELEILRGLSIEIPLISIEFTPEMKKNTFGCISIMESLGSYEYNYSSQETSVFSFDWKSSKDIIAYLDSIESTREFGDVYIKIKK
jgi:FkbM family methyltransferase